MTGGRVGAVLAGRDVNDRRQRGHQRQGDLVVVVVAGTQEPGPGTVAAHTQLATGGAQLGLGDPPQFDRRTGGGTGDHVPGAGGQHDDIAGHELARPLPGHPQPRGAGGDGVHGGGAAVGHVEAPRVTGHDLRHHGTPDPGDPQHLGQCVHMTSVADPLTIDQAVSLSDKKLRTSVIQRREWRT